MAKKSKKMRSLKDKEKVLYAPFSNIGSLNFEKTTGYITIPDKQVIYTRVQEEDQELAKIARDQEEAEGNEGQKMVWQLQDLNKHITAEEIEAPQLLAGIDIDQEEEIR